MICYTQARALYQREQLRGFEEKGVSFHRRAGAHSWLHVPTLPGRIPNVVRTSHRISIGLPCPFYFLMGHRSLRPRPPGHSGSQIPSRVPPQLDQFSARGDGKASSR